MTVKTAETQLGYSDNNRRGEVPSAVKPLQQQQQQDLQKQNNKKKIITHAIKKQTYPIAKGESKLIPL